MDNVESTNTITPNSDTLLIDETSSRFSSAIWAQKINEVLVTLAGLGGIGSYVGFLLSRVKPSRIIMYDPDVVEFGNMSGQLYGKEDVGKYKVSSLLSFIKNYSDYYNCYCHNSRFTEDSGTSKVMICGFDNMESRKVFYNSWRDYLGTLPVTERSNALFIDGRLAAEEFQVFCIKGDDEYHMKEYEDKWLFSDQESEETICSYKQTSHCATMIASVIVNLFINFIANKCEPLIERDVPFMTYYDASTMYFKTLS